MLSTHVPFISEMKHSKVDGAYCLGVFQNGKDPTTLLGGQTLNFHRVLSNMCYDLVTFLITAICFTSLNMCWHIRHLECLSILQFHNVFSHTLWALFLCVLTFFLYFSCVLKFFRPLCVLTYKVHMLTRFVLQHYARILCAILIQHFLILSHIKSIRSIG